MVLDVFHAQEKYSTNKKPLRRGKYTQGRTGFRIGRLQINGQSHDFKGSTSLKCFDSHPEERSYREDNNYVLVSLSRPVP